MNEIKLKELGKKIKAIDEDKDFFVYVLSVCFEELECNKMLKYLEEHPNATQDDVLEYCVRIRYENGTHPNAKLLRK